MRRVSAALQDARAEAVERELGNLEEQDLEEAYWRLLRAQTSCNYYWGEDWVHRAHADLDTVEASLLRYKTRKYSMNTDIGWHPEHN
jgi:hypothetical protein